ncbi:S1C family serine protease [Streptomyces sp. bgisy100]|uniref:S1C family serine protease n=1 Tax=Streptomyces sp. bgisy100 TaxID=3413783 RepID=UPI003D71D748
MTDTRAYPVPQGPDQGASASRPPLDARFPAAPVQGPTLPPAPGGGGAGARPGGWGGSGGGVPGAASEAGPPGGHRRRARRPVALLAAVALAAAAVGGGTALLVEHATGGAAGGGNAVAGTTAAVTTKGTVAGVASAVAPSVVEISASSPGGKSTGSGVITTADGEILTNNHVISGASSVTVTFHDGRTATAKVVGTDPDLDMALLKAEGVNGLKAATLGNSDAVKVGDQVVAIGSPEGLTGTVTSGIVSALDRDVTVRKDGGQRSPGDGDRWPFSFGGGQYNGEVGSSTTTYKALQTDASLNPGNSGGALVDMEGRIIGINSAMYTPSSGGGAASGAAGSIGLGFAIPVNDVRGILDDLRDGD